MLNQKLKSYAEILGIDFDHDTKGINDAYEGNTNRVLNEVENASIQWVGKSLNLESKVCLKFIFSLGSYTSDLSDLSLRVSYTDTYGNSKAGTIDNKDDVLTCSFFPRIMVS